MAGLDYIRMWLQELLDILKLRVPEFSAVMLVIARSQVTRGGQIACCGGSRYECEHASFGSSCKVQISVSQVQFDSRLHVKRPASLWMWAAPPLIFMQCTRPRFSQIHTQVFLGVMVMQKIACLEVGQYECGQVDGEGHVGRLISQANIRFAYLDSQRRGRVLQEILKCHPSNLSQETFCVLKL